MLVQPGHGSDRCGYRPVTCGRRRNRNRARRSEEHTSELQSQSNLVCRLLLEKKKKIRNIFPKGRLYTLDILKHVTLSTYSCRSCSFCYPFHNTILDVPRQELVVLTLLAQRIY